MYTRGGMLLLTTSKSVSPLLGRSIMVGLCLRKTHNPDIELLGIVPRNSKESALALEKQLLQRFERVHPKRDLVYFTEDLRLWLKKNSIKLPLLERFKQFQNHTEQHKLEIEFGIILRKELRS